MRIGILRLKYGRWGSYNNPEVNERKAELPLAFWFIGCFPDDLIEIGEVTPFYRPPRHTVYDMVPERPETVMADAAAVEFRGKNVLSISTIEHIGTTDYGLAPEPGKAFCLVEKIVAEAKNWLVTFPIGCNKELEDRLFSSGLNFFALTRNRDNTWRQASPSENLQAYKYNSPLPHGNAVVIITNIRLDVEFADYIDAA